MTSLKFKTSILLFFLMLLPTSLFSQVPQKSRQPLLKSLPEYQWIQKELNAKWSRFKVMESTEPQVVDVQQYTLAIEFFPATYTISGEVTIEAETLGVPVDTIYIDCHDNLTVSSLQFNGSPKSYTHLNDQLMLTFTSPLAPYQTFEVQISYQGSFVPFQGQGLIFSEHGEGVPVIASLSEPYLAPSWWPCIDNPADKALLEFFITCPSLIGGNEMKAFSNGTLQGTTINGNGTTTFHWSETYPITTYLVMVAISNYTEISSLPNTFTSIEGNTVPLSYYCYPEHLAIAEYHFAQVHDLLDLFSYELGEYPFIFEKHAIIEIPMDSSGMEHQTITCISDERVGDTEDDYFARVLVGHEVSHQWFGDFVTMETWHDLWLNEGLATFFQFYYREAFGEISAAIEKLRIFDTNLFGDSYVSPIYVRDTADPFAESGAVYFKGAWVIHMLREMIDDDALFFSILRTYLINHAYSNTETNDLKAAFESGLGVALDFFFDQWIYTPLWPIYSLIYENSSSNGGYKVDINLRQIQDHDVIDIAENPLRDYYIMPVAFTVHYKDETSETFPFVMNNQRNQSFQLFTDKEPDYTVFDEDLNILREAYEETADNDGIPSDGDYNGIPGDNPCSGGGAEGCDDNCPDIPNGPDGGTCTAGNVGDPCQSNQDCGSCGYCSMQQEDADGDGIGDVCDQTAPTDLRKAPVIIPSGTGISQDQNSPTTVTLGVDDVIVWKNDNNLSHVSVNYRIAGGCGFWGPDTLLGAPDNRWCSWSWFSAAELTPDVTYEFRIILQDGAGGPQAIYDGYFIRPTLP